MLSRLALFASLLLASSVSHAVLVLRGTDELGNRLIYDTYLDVTWYDFSNGEGVLSYKDQTAWVDSLTVKFNETELTDWRLPQSSSGAWSYGYDGSTTAGFNITSSEMGNLYYASLKKTGAYNELGGELPPHLWANTDFLPFLDLRPGMYWSSTPDPRAPTAHFSFSFYSGYQFSLGEESGAYAMAVRDGDVVTVPEPSMSLLLLTATGAGLIGGRRRRQRTARCNAGVTGA